MAVNENDKVPGLPDSGSFGASISRASDAAEAGLHSAHEISAEAGDTLATAGSDMSQLFEIVRQEAVNMAKAAADYVQQEVELHPKAAVAAGAAAGVAVLGMIALKRRAKPNKLAGLD